MVASPPPPDEQFHDPMETTGSGASFAMSYSPARSDRQFFVVPVVSRLSAYAFFAFALSLGVIVVIARATPGSHLHHWMASGDAHRPFSSATIAIFVGVCGLGTVVRAHLQGVTLATDGVEIRDLSGLGFPRTGRWVWAEIHRVIVDDRFRIAIETWNGGYEKLPDVQDARACAEQLCARAAARKIAVTQFRPDSLG